MEGVTRKTPALTLFVYEFLGTAFLMFAINGSEGNAVGIGLSLTFLLVIGGPLTGAHYNPAVTLGVFINEDNKEGIKGRCLLMMIAQFTGAFFGALMSLCLVTTFGNGVPYKHSALLCEIDNDPTSDTFGMCIASGTGYAIMNIACAEIFCVIYFVAVNLAVKTKSTAPSGDGLLCCLTVGLALMAMIFVSGHADGAAINPAVAFAQSTYQWLLYKDTTEYNKNESSLISYVWVYFFADFVGAAIAGSLWLCHRKATDTMLKEKKATESQINYSGALDEDQNPLMSRK